MGNRCLNSLRSVMARVMLASTSSENRQAHIRRDLIIEGAYVLDPQFEERPWRSYIDCIGSEIRNSKMPRWDQHGGGTGRWGGTGEIYHSLTEVGEALAEGSAGQALVEADRELLRLHKELKAAEAKCPQAAAARSEDVDVGTARRPVRSWTSSRGLVARCLLAGCRRFNGILGRCQLFVDPEQPNASEKRLRNALNAEKERAFASLAARVRRCVRMTAAGQALRVSAKDLIAAEEAIVAAHGTAEMKGELVTEEEAAQDDDEEMGEGEEADDDNDDDDIACLVCKGLDEEEMLLCDGLNCDNAYHMKCLSPPVKIAGSDWLCFLRRVWKSVDPTKPNSSSMDVDEEDQPFVTEAEGYKLHLSSKGATGYFGVTFNKASGKFQGRFNHVDKTVTCGLARLSRRR